MITIELDITQQVVSQLEKRQELDDETIATYARIVGIDEFFIRNMFDDSLMDGITNFFDIDNSTQILNFNPLDKVIELFAEKDELYERLLKEKEKVNTYLEKTLDKLSK